MIQPLISMRFLRRTNRPVDHTHQIDHDHLEFARPKLLFNEEIQILGKIVKLSRGCQKRSLPKNFLVRYSSKSLSYLVQREGINQYDSYGLNSLTACINMVDQKCSMLNMSVFHITLLAFYSDSSCLLVQCTSSYLVLHTCHTRHNCRVNHDHPLKHEMKSSRS